MPLMKEWWLVWEVRYYLDGNITAQGKVTTTVGFLNLP